MNAISQITGALSRRKMLMGLAASATAATAGSASTQTPTECPDLLALADKLEGTTQAHVDARAEVARIVALWSSRWPTPGEEIQRYSNGCQVHRGISGQGIEVPFGRSGLMQVPSVGTPEVFEESRKRHLAEYERKMKTKSQRGAKTALLWAERDEAAIEPSRAYWAEVERIKTASGIEAAQAAATSTREALCALVGQILEHREKTITGVVIKAQALAAWSEVDRFYRCLNPAAPLWADQIAGSIMRQAGDAA